MVKFKITVLLLIVVQILLMGCETKKLNREFSFPTEELPKAVKKSEVLFVGESNLQLEIELAGQLTFLNDVFYFPQLQPNILTLVKIDSTFNQSLGASNITVGSINKVFSLTGFANQLYIVQQVATDLTLGIASTTDLTNFQSVIQINKANFGCSSLGSSGEYLQITAVSQDELYGICDSALNSGKIRWFVLNASGQLVSAKEVESNLLSYPVVRASLVKLSDIFVVIVEDADNTGFKFLQTDAGANISSVKQFKFTSFSEAKPLLRHFNASTANNDSIFLQHSCAVCANNTSNYCCSISKWQLQN